MADEINPNATVVWDNEAENMYLNFAVGKEVYGIGVCSVLQIVAMQEISEMPEMPLYMKGFINLRGSVIPVCSLHAIFGKPEPEYTERSCIIIIDLDGRQLGLIAESVKEAITIEPDSISLPPKLGTAGANDYVKGIAHLADGQAVIFLNVSNLFHQAE